MTERPGGIPEYCARLSKVRDVPLIVSRYGASQNLLAWSEAPLRRPPAPCRKAALCPERKQKLQHVGADIDELRKFLPVVCVNPLGREYQIEGSIIDHRDQCEQ